MFMKAVVMAGGEGTRLRPLTSNRPKPLVPILGKPIAQHIIEHLARAGITEIVVTLYYLAEEIQNYFGDGSELGVKASGGVRTHDDAAKMVGAGANRIGASASVAIVMNVKTDDNKSASPGKQRGAY